MVNINLAALTNALTDVTLNVKEKDLRNLGIKKGSANSLKKINLSEFSALLLKTKATYCQAGSPANTIFNTSKLGLRTALIGNVGYDDIGNMYIEKLLEVGIEPFFSRTTGKSGICYILLTPDRERTNLADLGVAGDFNINLDKLEKTNFFHTSGYEVASNPDKAEEIINYIKNIGAKLSFDLASNSMIRQERKTIENIVEKTDILFATEEEAKEFTGYAPFRALKELRKICPIVSLKRGVKGSIVKNKEEQHKIQVYPIKLINTCGAGDAYASGFLFAYIRKFSLKECGCMGSYIASRVCNSEKPHLNTKNNQK